MGDKRKGRSLSRPKKRKFYGRSTLEKKSASAEVDTSEAGSSCLESPEAIPEVAENVYPPEPDLPDELDETSDEESDDGVDELTGNRIANLECLREWLSAVGVCRHSRRGELCVEESFRSGLASTVVTRCDSCHQSETRALVKRNTPVKCYDVNRHSVLGMRLIGRGREALQQLCCILDIPPPVSKSNYSFHTKALHSAAEEVAKASMRDAAAHVLALQAGLQHPSHVAVSTDGTWMRRGFCSVFGVQTVIGYNTAKVLDVEVLSKHCSMCETWRSRRQAGKLTAEEYGEWKESHADTCLTNTDVSSGMETEAVLRLWQRSIDVNSLRYTIYIGDGDSKGHRTVSDAKPYGDITISKEECIGHVSKRLGKGLRDLKQHLGNKKLSDGKPIGGRGRLTNGEINKLQNYYGDAVRAHAGNVQDTARAIWASLFRRASSDEIVYRHHDTLPDAVVQEMKSVYNRLTERSLLERCERSTTQNVNEALNGTIWRMCPKESFCNRTTVETAVYLAVIKFNDGHEKLQDVLDRMSCIDGSFT